jgi:hypothetical protein
MLRPYMGENEPGRAARKKEKGKSREAATCPTNIVSHWGPIARDIFVFVTQSSDDGTIPSEASKSL